MKTVKLVEENIYEVDYGEDEDEDEIVQIFKKREVSVDM